MFANSVVCIIVVVIKSNVFVDVDDIEINKIMFASTAFYIIECCNCYKIS